MTCMYEYSLPFTYQPPQSHCVCSPCLPAIIAASDSPINSYTLFVNPRIINAAIHDMMLALCDSVWFWTFCMSCEAWIP